MIALRKGHQVFGRGTLEFIKCENRRIFAFTRAYRDETVFCAYNLSRSSQPASFDLSSYAGLIPVDMQYEVAFLRIGTEPYQLTFNEYGFYWFLLRQV